MSAFENPVETARIELAKLVSPRSAFSISSSTSFGQPEDQAETARIEARKAMFKHGNL